MANRLGLHDAEQAVQGNVLDGASDSEDVRSRQRQDRAGEARSSLEQHFDPTFATRLALREKQIQQNYRPIIGIHKWFARRPGSVFRSLLLAEYNSSEPLEASYWREHKLTGVIADPFMGGGTPIFEANRLGFSVLGADTNPMALSSSAASRVSAIVLARPETSTLQHFGGIGGHMLSCMAVPGTFSAPSTGS